MRTYRHYKGGEYFIICHATVEATGETVVVYQAVRGLKRWTRPTAEFYGEVDVEGRRVPRFQEVKDAPPFTGFGDPPCSKCGTQTVWQDHVVPYIYCPVCEPERR